MGMCSALLFEDISMYSGGSKQLCSSKEMVVKRDRQTSFDSERHCYT